MNLSHRWNKWTGVIVVCNGWLIKDAATCPKLLRCLNGSETEQGQFMCGGRAERQCHMTQIPLEIILQRQMNLRFKFLFTELKELLQCRTPLNLPNEWFGSHERLSLYSKSQKVFFNHYFYTHYVIRNMKKWKYSLSYTHRLLLPPQPSLWMMSVKLIAIPFPRHAALGGFTEARTVRGSEKVSFKGQLCVCARARFYCLLRTFPCINTDLVGTVCPCGYITSGVLVGGKVWTEVSYG